MKKNREIKTVVVFGSAGLVGYQVARKIVKYINPKNLVLCSLYQEDAINSAEKLKNEFLNIGNVFTEHGNLFTREALSKETYNEIYSDNKKIDALYSDLFSNLMDFENFESREQNLMSNIIIKYKPDIVIDTINTATAISYQNSQKSSNMLKQFKDNLEDLINKINKNIFENTHHLAKLKNENVIGLLTSYLRELTELCVDKGLNNYSNLQLLNILLVSQPLPQLIKHVIILHRALITADTYMYVKVGTTGSGGMGINIPYTHGEDKPSFSLMSKAAIGFAHTGLLYLLSKTPNGPIIKEVKPGAMIGYRDIFFRSVSASQGNIKKWETKKEKLGNALNLFENEKNYSDKGSMELVLIDTGENGLFCCGEFEAITYPGSMEFVTAEEVAKNILLEITGNNSGKDIINGITSTIVAPSYLAGTIRQESIRLMLALEKEKNIPSIALGKLGPPQLSKLLFEAYLLRQKYNSLKEFSMDDISPEMLGSYFESLILKNQDLQTLITSIGIPILLTDGETILRGPRINIPESTAQNVNITSKNVDDWANQGWVDLRKNNMLAWMNRAKKMLSSISEHSTSSAFYADPTAYKSDKIKIGEVVGWIFANEFNGHRLI